VSRYCDGLGFENLTWISPRGKFGSRGELDLVRLTLLGSSRVVALNFRFFGFMISALLVPDCGNPTDERGVSSFPVPKWGLGPKRALSPKDRVPLAATTCCT